MRYIYLDAPGVMDFYFRRAARAIYETPGKVHLQLQAHARYSPCYFGQFMAYRGLLRGGFSMTEVG